MSRSLWIVFVTLVFFSCSKKNTDTPNPGSPPVQPGTYALLKSTMQYYFDEAGNKTGDSTLLRYNYDGQRRLILSVTNGYHSGLYDSAIKSYPTGQSIGDDFFNWRGASTSRSHSISYLNNKGLADSIYTETLVTDTIFGSAGAPYKTISLEVYLRDAKGNDTSYVAYSVNNGVKEKGLSIRKKFDKNNQLQIQETFEPSGFRKWAIYYLNGVRNTDTTWYENSQSIYVQHYSYTSYSDPSFQSNDSPYLVSTIETYCTNCTPSNFTQTYTYTFNDSKRLSTTEMKYSDRPGYTPVYTIDYHTYY